MDSAQQFTEKDPSFLNKEIWLVLSKVDLLLELETLVFIY